jgi:hypothetical protein
MVQQALFMLHVTLALIGGGHMVKALGHVFDQNNWAVFHSWGLMHGSMFLVAPIFCSQCYVLLWTAPIFKANIKHAKFIQPHKGLVRIIPDPLMFALAFGPLYFLAKRMWSPAITYLALYTVSFGMAWPIVAFRAREEVTQYLQNNGWQRG